MSKRICGFIQTCVTAVGMIAEAAMLTFKPAYYGAIAAAIGIAVPAIPMTFCFFSLKAKKQKNRSLTWDC